MSSSRETTSLLAWINSYKDVLNEFNDGIAVNDISELADGILLSGILTKVWVQLVWQYKPPNLRVFKWSRGIPSYTETKRGYFIHY